MVNKLLLPLSAACLITLSLTLLAGCGVAPSESSVADSNATSEEYPLLSPEDLSVIATQICPRATVADVDLDLLQMGRDVAASFGSEIDYEMVPFQNLSNNATTWDYIFRTLATLQISSNLQSTLASATTANSETVGLATDFLTSGERESSGAQEMIDLISAQGVVALGQLEVNSICFDISTIGTSSDGD